MKRSLIFGLAILAMIVVLMVTYRTESAGRNFSISEKQMSVYTFGSVRHTDSSARDFDRQGAGAAGQRSGRDPGAVESAVKVRVNHHYQG